MSCLTEVTCVTYVDGELEPEERRTVESHLVGCLDCRRRIVDLRAESSLLEDVLQERARARPRQPVPQAPARTLAFGFGPLLAAGFAITLVAGWVVEALAPTAGRLLAPFTLRGATDMFFDAVFMLRDEAPALFEAGLAVAAMASASALLTFTLTALLRRWSGTAALLALGLLFASAGEGRAHFGLHEHEAFSVPAGELHEGTLVVSADSVSIDGTVDGDVIAMAHRLAIRGEVRGNVIALARTVELRGHITGTAALATGRLENSGRIDSNLYVFAEESRLGASAFVARDAAMVAEDGVIEGTVGRDLFAGGQRVELRGPVERHVRVWAESLHVLDGARVRGDLTATLPSGEDVELEGDATVAGEITTSVRRHEGGGLSRLRDSGFYLWIALHIGSGFLVGLLIRLLLPELYSARVDTPAEVFRAMAWGFAVLVAAPLALLLVGLTLVGIPLALMGFALYFSAAYVAVIIVAALIGAALVHPGESWTSFGLSLLAGLTLVFAVAHTPFVGPLALAVILVVGLGLLAQWAISVYRVTRPA